MTERRSNVEGSAEVDVDGINMVYGFYSINGTEGQQANLYAYTNDKTYLRSFG